MQNNVPELSKQPGHLATALMRLPAVTINFRSRTGFPTWLQNEAKPSNAMLVTKHWNAGKLCQKKSTSSPTVIHLDSWIWSEISWHSYVQVRIRAFQYKICFRQVKSAKSIDCVPCLFKKLLVQNSVISGIFPVPPMWQRLLRACYSIVVKNWMNVIWIRWQALHVFPLNFSYSQYRHYLFISHSAHWIPLNCTWEDFQEL